MKIVLSVFTALNTCLLVGAYKSQWRLSNTQYHSLKVTDDITVDVELQMNEKTTVYTSSDSRDNVLNQVIPENVSVIMTDVDVITGGLDDVSSNSDAVAVEAVAVEADVVEPTFVQDSIPSFSTSIISTKQLNIPSSDQDKPEKYSLAVQSNKQLANTAISAAKSSAQSLASVVSSVAEATVSFSRSDEANESLKAAALAGNALSEASKSLFDAIGVFRQEWTVSSKDVNSEEGADSFFQAFATTVQRATKNKDLKPALDKAAASLTRCLKEITNVYGTVVLSLGTEIGTSRNFKQALSETVDNLTFLVSVLLEAIQRTASELTVSKALPPANPNSE